MSMPARETQLPGDRLSGRRLTRWYVAALTTVALLSIVGQVLVQSSLRGQAKDAHVVNLAGRQRMLSQQICKSALAITSDDSQLAREKYSDQLRSALAEWQLAHVGLQNGDARLGLPGDLPPDVAAMFADVQPQYAGITNAAEHLLDTLRLSGQATTQVTLESDVRELLAQESSFLDKMDDLVAALDAAAQARVQMLQRIELLLLLVTLLVLGAEGVLVFRPAVRLIRTAFDNLQTAGRELHLAKDAAEAANRAKSRFLANMSHEIRTPLNAILGLTEAALSDNLPPAQRHNLEVVEQSAESLLHLLNQTLDLARVESGKLQLDARPFEFRACIKAAVDTLALEARRKQITLEYDVAADVPATFIGDVDRIRQVLTNLLHNGIKFTDAGEVRMQVRLSRIVAGKAELTITVTDTGIGIDQADQARIFEAFTQADASTTRRHGGAGLGLSIVSQLVGLMHGHVQLHSELGRGSTFTVTLPLALADDNAAQFAGERAVHSKLDNRAHSSRPSRRLRILVAEDTPANQLVVDNILSKAGHTVVAVDDGRRAVEAFRDEPFDLILMDVQMPQLDGLAAAREIRKLEKEEGRDLRVPILAVTALVLPQDRQRVLASGMNELLCKPLRRAELLAAIDRLMYPAKIADEQCDAAASASGNRLASVPRYAHEDPQLWSELAEMFCRETPGILQQLQQAVASARADVVEILAHRLCGMAGTLDASPVVAAARNLEDLARAGATQRLDPALVELATSLARFHEALTCQLANTLASPI